VCLIGESGVVIHSLRDRWKPLEAALAAVGSQAEDIIECLEDEQESGRQKPVDIEQLLAHVVPSLLNQAGNWASLSVLLFL
jgi:hypothetical protein